jgi:ABC-type multidrug transport system ATPase subunit
MIIDAIAARAGVGKTTFITALLGSFRIADGADVEISGRVRGNANSNCHRRILIMKKTFQLFDRSIELGC